MQFRLRGSISAKDSSSAIDRVIRELTIYYREYKEGAKRMKCPDCGANNPSDYVFCEDCGTRIRDVIQDVTSIAQKNSASQIAPDSYDMYVLDPDTILHSQQYRIVEKRGRGGFGITYRAIDTHLGREVAIKELCPPGARRDGLSVVPDANWPQGEWQHMIDTFQGEAKILANLDHPNIVDVHSFFKENNTAYMVMEFLEGVDLHFLVLDKGVERERALRYVEKIGDALNELHKRKIVHGDVKPSNIMLVTEDRPVLIDFGTARLWAEDKKLNPRAQASRNFAAPEQLDGSGNIGPHTDVYGLAATCYFLLTKQLPTPNGPDRELDNPFVANAIKGGLRSDPEERLQDVTEFLEVLWDRTTYVVRSQPTSITEDEPTVLSYIPPPQIVSPVQSAPINVLGSTHVIEPDQAGLNVHQTPPENVEITEIANVTPSTHDLPGEAEAQGNEGTILKASHTSTLGNALVWIARGFLIALILGAAAAVTIFPPTPPNPPLVPPTATVTPIVTELPTVTATVPSPTPTDTPPPATATTQPTTTPFIPNADQIFTPFLPLWNRTERPQAGSRRPPIWGYPLPTPTYHSMQLEVNQTILVQYFEKGIMRMPVNSITGAQPDLGLPVVEMLMATPEPPCIRIIGDASNIYAPTYRTFEDYVTLHGEDGPPNREGQVITQTLSANGLPGYLDEAKRKKYENEARVAWYEEEVEGIKHNIPTVFWNYLNAKGPVYIDESRPSERSLIQGSYWSEITGEPISEAYWVEFSRGHGREDALIQAFQRRILTYVPSNNKDFQVEMVNVGRHYYDWKYLGRGNCQR